MKTVKFIAVVCAIALTVFLLACGPSVGSAD